MNGSAENKKIMEIVVWILVFFLVKTVQSMRDLRLSKNASSTLDTLLASDRYDKRIRPGFGGESIKQDNSVCKLSLNPAICFQVFFCCFEAAFYF